MNTGAARSNGIKALARIGYTAKGIVYALIGLLATMAAFNVGGETTGATGAINKMAGQRFGSVLLVGMIVGLLCYVLWRFAQALLDPERKGHSLGGLLARAGLFISGLFYAALTWSALQLLLSASAGSTSSGSKAGRLMSYPAGRWLIVAIGVAFIGVGLYQAWRAWSDSFRAHWDEREMPQRGERWAARLARVGLFARTIVFSIIGTFLMIAGIQADQSDARGLGGALDTLSRQPFGPWLLAGVGLGLICYGGYCFINACYRDIDTTR